MIINCPPQGRPPLLSGQISDEFTVIVFYYFIAFYNFIASEICPDKRGGLL
jgi:hypothetical protein